MNVVDKLVAGHGAEEVVKDSSELQLVLSASLDCSVCIWCLDTG